MKRQEYISPFSKSNEIFQIGLLKVTAFLTESLCRGIDSGMNFYAQLGKRIRQIRELRGLSQAGLGEILHRVQPVIYQWEKGKTRLMVEDLWLLAQALQVPIAAFFDEDGWGESGSEHSAYPVNWDLQVAASYLSAGAQRELITFLLLACKKQRETEVSPFCLEHDSKNSSGGYSISPGHPDPECRKG